MGWRNVLVLSGDVAFSHCLCFTDACWQDVVWQ